MKRRNKTKTNGVSPPCPKREREGEPNGIDVGPGYKLAIPQPITHTMVNSCRSSIRHFNEYRALHRGALKRFVDGECLCIAGREDFTIISGWSSPSLNQRSGRVGNSYSDKTLARARCRRRLYLGIDEGSVEGIKGGITNDSKMALHFVESSAVTKPRSQHRGRL